MRPQGDTMWWRVFWAGGGCGFVWEVEGVEGSENFVEN